MIHISRPIDVYSLVIRPFLIKLKITLSIQSNRSNCFYDLVHIKTLIICNYLNISKSVKAFVGNLELIFVKIPFSHGIVFHLPKWSNNSSTLQ